MEVSCPDLGFYGAQWDAASKTRARVSCEKRNRHAMAALGMLTTNLLVPAEDWPSPRIRRTYVVIDERIQHLPIEQHCGVDDIQPPKVP
jgi:hypothetical protein